MSDFKPTLCLECHQPRGRRPKYCSAECAANAKAEAARMRGDSKRYYQEHREAINEKRRAEYQAAVAASKEANRILRERAEARARAEGSESSTTDSGPRR